MLSPTFEQRDERVREKENVSLTIRTITTSATTTTHRESMGENKLTRLCHIVKREDFDGYGFNLHAEKGKPGQYIGKVDDDSPAEAAGLKQGDRIIEVNGVNIGNETHKQVVQRIKAIADEVRLLVVDPTVVSVSNNNQVIDSNDVTTSNGSNETEAAAATTTTTTTSTTDVTTEGATTTTTTTTTMQSSSASDHENANDVNDAPTAAGTPATAAVAAVKAATNGQNGQSPNSNQTNDSHAHSPTTNTSSMTTTATGNWDQKLYHYYAITLQLPLQMLFLQNRLAMKSIIFWTLEHPFSTQNVKTFCQFTLFVPHSQYANFVIPNYFVLFAFIILILNEYTCSNNKRCQQRNTKFENDCSRAARQTSCQKEIRSEK